MWNRLTSLFKSSPAPAAQEQRAITLADWPQILLEGVETAAAISVNPQSAMRCSAVNACVGTLSGVLATLPLGLYERAATGQRRPVTSHPVLDLLTTANPSTSTSTLVEQLTIDALLLGSGMSYIVRANGQPRELHRVLSSAVAVTIDERSREPVYRINNEPVPFPDIVHLKAPGSLDIKGDSPTLQAREAIGLALVLQKHASKLFGNSARPSGVLSFPPDMTAEQAQNARAAWQASTAGEAAGSTAVIYGGGKWEQRQLTSVDAQFVELIERTNYDICRHYRVPPILAFEYGRATWGNAGQQADAFLKFGLNRWLQAWTDELRLKLLSPDEQRTMYFAFDTDQLLQSDLQARADAYQKLVASRVLNPNECRELEDRAPYDGGDEFTNPNVQAVKSNSPEPTGAANE